jgi:hypothetical protein
MTNKTCTKCHEIKDTSKFYKDNRRKDGFRCWCKQCTIADNKVREPSYHDKRKAYRIIHKEQISERARNKYDSKKEKINADNKVWYQTPKGRLKTYKRNADLREIEWKLTDEEFYSFWNKNCTYCDSPIVTIGLDRIDPKKEYTLDNVTSCCPKCNTIKMDLDIKEFTDKITKIYNHMKLWDHT